MSTTADTLFLSPTFNAMRHLDSMHDAVARTNILLANYETIPETQTLYGIWQLCVHMMQPHLSNPLYFIKAQPRTYHFIYQRSQQWNVLTSLLALRQALFADLADFEMEGKTRAQQYKVDVLQCFDEASRQRILKIIEDPVALSNEIQNEMILQPPSAHREALQRVAAFSHIPWRVFTDKCIMLDVNDSF